MYNKPFFQIINPTVTAFASFITLAIEQTHYNPGKLADEEARLVTFE